MNDARAIAQGLQQLGFRVTLGENLTRRDFIERFNTFENSVRAGDTAFVFYSGHGVELDGANYLVPTDAPKVAPQQQSLLKDESISTDNIIQRLKARGTKSQIIVLDACRENPFRQAGGRSVGGARGLAPTQTPGGVFVIYSAGVGEVALDRLSDNDADPNSVFTRSFLPLLSDPSQSLVAVAKETRLRVKSLAATIGATQSPAYYDEIDGDLYLARADTASATPVVPLPPRTELPPPVTPPTNLAKEPEPARTRAGVRLHLCQFRSRAADAGHAARTDARPASPRAQRDLRAARTLLPRPAARRLFQPVRLVQALCLGRSAQPGRAGERQSDHVDGAVTASFRDARIARAGNP